MCSILSQIKPNKGGWGGLALWFRVWKRGFSRGIGKEKRMKRGRFQGQRSIFCAALHVYLDLFVWMSLVKWMISITFTCLFGKSTNSNSLVGTGFSCSICGSRADEDPRKRERRREENPEKFYRCRCPVTSQESFTSIDRRSGRTIYHSNHIVIVE